MKKYLSYLIIVLVILSNLVLPVQAESKGELLFGVWFSRSKIFTEKVVRVYVSLVNQSNFDVMGTIELYDNGVFVNKRNILIVNGKSNDWWFDHPDQSFVYGEHVIKVVLVKSFIREIGKSVKEVAFKNNIFTKTIFVDRDTDDDGIGDLEDPDIDGDEISNKEELMSGLDPKVKNSELEIKAARERFRNKNRSNPVSIEKTNDPLDKILSLAPQYIANPIKKSDQIISDLSSELAKDLTEKRKETLKEIEINGKKEAKGSKLTLNPDDGKIESRFLSEGGLASLPGLAIFKKIYAAILFGLISVLENKIILYPVLFFIIYKLIRLVFRRMTRNRKPLS